MTERLCVLPHDKPRSATVGLLCAGCLHRVERDLAHLPALCSWLAVQLAPSSGGGERVSGTREAPMPLRADVLDHLELVAAQAASWARLVAEERGLQGPQTHDVDRNRSWTGVERTVPFLLAHLSWIAGQPWVDELSAEVATLSRVGHGLAPWLPARHRLPAPCPSCDGMTLVRWDGDAVVRCDSRAGGCGREWAEEDYARLIVVLASEVKAS